MNITELLKKCNLDPVFNIYMTNQNIFNNIYNDFTCNDIESLIGINNINETIYDIAYPPYNLNNIEHYTKSNNPNYNLDVYKLICVIVVFLIILLKY